MKHIVSFSGGLTSWYVAYQLSQKVEREDLILMFADTLAEHKTLYKFLIQTSSKIFEIEDNIKLDEIYQMIESLPEVYEDEQGRKAQLFELATKYNEICPQFVWLINGKHLWEVFEHRKYISNGYIADCSKDLKQKVCRSYLKDYHEPEETMVYIGIDWTETHRVEGAKSGWLPYETKFPLAEDLKFNKAKLVQLLEELKIDLPELYKQNKLAGHNNCSNFCVRSGQGGFIHLLHSNPELYKYHENKEQELRSKLGKDVSILNKHKDKEKFRYTLKELREDYERNNPDIDIYDIGGCGCFITEAPKPKKMKIGLGEVKKKKHNKNKKNNR